jgi:ferritin-like metal-binding protein YciE
MEASMPDKTLSDLFLDTLKDIYFAEKQILKTLPKMARAAQSDELRAGFEEHQQQTEGQVERLEQVFEILGATPRGKTCDAILGITEEGKEIMEECYGTLKTWAQTLGLHDAVALLDATLQEEIGTDQKLSALATSSVNAQAE